MTTDISIDHSSGACRITTGQMRQTFRSTPRAVGLALIGMDRESADLTDSMTWQDHLATHGVLIGTRRKQVATLIVLPRREREVEVPRQVRGEWTGSHSQRISFPPTLIGLLTDNGAYRSSCLSLIDVNRQATFSMVSQVPVLVPWPYGNVYSDHGGICWGSVNHAGIHTIKDLEERFFGSGFNRDLWQGAVAGVTHLAAGSLPDIDPARYTWTFPRVIEGLLGRGRS